jgi:hypothetical protein
MVDGLRLRWSSQMQHRALLLLFRASNWIDSTRCISLANRLHFSRTCRAAEPNDEPAASLPTSALLGPDFHRLDRTSLRLAHLFDHLVGSAAWRERNGDGECLGCLEADDLLEFCEKADTLNNRQVSFIPTDLTRPATTRPPHQGTLAPP